MSRRGYTLLEMVIVVAILALVITAVYGTIKAVEQTYDTDTALRNRQSGLQAALDQISQDLKESSSALVISQAFVEPAGLPPPAPGTPPYSANQALLAIPSARPSTGKGSRPDNLGPYASSNTKPSWQSLVVYAPYWNSNLNRGEIRRYVLNVVSQAYFNPGKNPTPINVTPTVITAAGAPAVKRSDGEIVLPNLQTFAVVAPNPSPGPDPVTGKVPPALPAWTIQVTSTSFVAGEGYKSFTQSASMESACQGRN